MLIQNPDVGQILRDEAKLQLAELPAVNVTPNVQAVIDVSPRSNRKLKTWASASSSTGGMTPYTGVAQRRLLIYGITLSFVKDATNDMATGVIQLTFTQDGISKTLISLPNLTLTAQQMSTEISFENPIVCDVGTSVTGSVTYTAGSMRRQSTVYGIELIE